MTLSARPHLQEEYAAGRRLRPTICDACSQSERLIEPHSEDYSTPYGAHIGRFSRYWTCHMMVHCRFNAPKAWQAYRDAVREGAVFKPFHRRTFNVFAALFLGDALPAPRRRRAPIAETRLDLIGAARRPQTPASGADTGPGLASPRAVRPRRRPGRAPATGLQDRGQSAPGHLLSTS